MKLFHYCSIETLFSLVKNKTVWFSDLLESNDSGEDVLLFKFYFDYIDKNVKDKQRVAFFKNEFDRERNRTRVYGLCFTEKNDDLSQWFSYAQTDSVAIELDKGEIESYFSRLTVLGEEACLKKVSYYSKSDELKEVFEELMKDEHPVNHFHVLLPKSAIIKGADWKVEKEWRCYFRNFIDSDNNPDLPEVKFDGIKCKLDFVVKKGRPVFHYEIPFDVRLIKSVTIGPNSHIGPKELFSSLRIINRRIPENLEVSKTKVTFVKR